MGNISAYRAGVALIAGLCASVLLTPLNSWCQGVNPSVEDPEEYSVYSAILSSEFSSGKVKRFVINSQTSNEGKKDQPFIGFVGGLAPSGAKRPDTKSETASDFDVKNKESGMLERKFDLKSLYVLTTNDELHRIFVVDGQGHADFNSWARFYKNYPGAPGIIAFSRVGFDRTRDEALVYMAVQSGLLGGRGMYLVLSKGGNTWKIEKRVILWFS